MNRPLLYMTILACLALTLHAAEPIKAPAKAPEKTPGYHVTKEIQIGGEGGWDYLTVDPTGRRLYVSHTNKVEVIDVDSGKKVGEGTGLSGVHGIAVPHDLDRGFISNGRSSTVTIFDLKTLASVGEVKSTGENPDAILYDPFSSQVFAFN